MSYIKMEVISPPFLFLICLRNLSQSFCITRAFPAICYIFAITKIIPLMKMLTSIFLALFSLVLFATAQERKISGRVTDENGNPLASVSVSVKNGVKGGTTNEKGEYSIQIPSSAKILLFSAVDFGSKEVAIGNQTNVNVILTSEAKALESVIVTAYGSSKRETFTGSAAKISAKDIQNRPLTNVGSALIGAAPGVAAVTANGQPGSAPAIRVRGFGSVSASNDPLYVVDGVPFTAAISNINMDDVESISILKDAATTSLYGSRAANGVVMITTKKGRKGRSNVNVKVNTSVTSRAIPDYDRVNADQYMPLMWEAYRNSLAYRATSPIALATASNIASGLVAGQLGIINLLGYNPYNLAANQVILPDGSLNTNAKVTYRQEDLDWFSPLTRDGIRNEYSMNFSGGSDKSDHFVSVGYLKENGYINRSDFERFNARVNLNSQLTNWFKVGTNLNFTKSAGNFASTDGSNSIVNPFFFAARMGPIFPVYAYDPARPGQYLLDANGNRQYDYGNAVQHPSLVRPAGAYGGRHTIAENELSKELFSRNVFNGRAYAEFKLTDWMKLTTNYATDFTNRYDLSYQNNIIGDGAPSGRSTKDYQTLVGTTFNQLLNINKQIKDHNFEGLIGHENYNLKEDYLSGQRQNQVATGNYELANFTTTTSVSSQIDNIAIESYFANFKYDYQGKYFVTLGGRTDGNSRFADSVRWGRFWSVSGAWVVSKEGFMSGLNWVNFLKLRSSYGTTGNDAGIGYYPYQTLYAIGRNNALNPGILQNTSLGNGGLTWESNKQFDLGVDFTILNNRVNGSAEYFNRVSDNLIFSVPLPMSSGFASTFRNVGSMYNRGFEIQLSGDLVRTKNVTLTLGMNATTFTNKITKLPQKEIISGTKKLMVGRSINDYWLREWYGVDPNDGAALYYNESGRTGYRLSAKGDTVATNPTNARFGYVGSAIPDWYGAFNFSLRYKNLTLSSLLNWQLGGLTYDDTYAAYMHSGTYGASLHVDMLQRWKNPGDITNVPRMDNAQTSFFGATSSRWLTDASYLNIQNITLAYDFKGRIQKKTLPFQAGRLFLSVENVRMFTKRSGMNPMQSFAGVTSIGYIPASVLNLGLNVNL
jgi:TonB-linked SusC/RagA family outer membrane protein